MAEMINQIEYNVKVIIVQRSRKTQSLLKTVGQVWRHARLMIKPIKDLIYVLSLLEIAI